jgi:hypothetical protein
MSKKMGSKKEHISVGIVQIAIFLILLGGSMSFIYKFAIPGGISGFVVPLFKPSADLIEKKPFVKFKGGIWATIKSDAAEKLGIKKVNDLYSLEGYNKSDVIISKEYIDGEYIFDVTFDARDTKEHGYIKKGGSFGEFYLKAPGLSESFPIILEPLTGFSILAFVLGGVLTFLVTLILPARLGLISALFENQIEHVKVKIRLQTGFTDEVVEVLTLPDNLLKTFERDEVEDVFRKVWERTTTDIELESKNQIKFDDVFDEDTDLVLFRNEAIYIRIKEFFSEFVLSEIADTRDGLAWKRNHFLIGAGLRLYLAHHFSEKYSNNVTGMAYAGAAVLIIAVGIRGLKFIPPSRPSFIFFAILLEFTLLSLMAITIFYTEEEERMDKMLKKMEDANRSQLETLRGQQTDIHQLSTALVGQTSEIIKKRIEESISDYMTSDDKIKQQIGNTVAEFISNNISFKSDSPKGSSAPVRRR